MYRSPTNENLGDLDFDLSVSLKVKFASATELPIYGFLLMFNVYLCLWPNWGPVLDIRL